ncbi:MAG: hypothetical protein IH946_05715, partial [Bacteroidetes bacterium]|nr:hypothetical protein [Bacteroidota bacterium]
MQNYESLLTEAYEKVKKVEGTGGRFEIPKIISKSSSGNLISISVNPLIFTPFPTDCIFSVKIYAAPIESESMVNQYVVNDNFMYVFRAPT